MASEGPLSDCTVRRFESRDAEAAEEIAKSSPEVAKWPEETFRESLNWPGVVAFASEADGRVTGFMVGRQVADEAEILNLAVTPSTRRRGAGGALLGAALEEFRLRGVRRVFLEVRESNKTGIAFYEKHGFLKTGRRASYYREPKEAAIVMEMKLEV